MESYYDFFAFRIEEKVCMAKQGCFNENAITSKKRNESDVIRNLIKRNVEYSD